MKRLFTLFVLTLMVMTVSAVPAKPGLKKTLTLADGTQVVTTVVGDEFGHWYVDANGNTYTQVSDGIFQKGSVEAIKAKAAARRTVANVKRSARLAAKKKVGSVGNYIGQKKCLIILVNFKDNRKFTTSKSYFDRIVNEPNFSDGNFKGSMYDYFKAQSEGLFELTFDIVGPVEVANNHSYYGGNNSSGDDKHPAEMVCEALDLADSEVNYADYDWDGDKVVDQVYVVYAGVGEADSDDTTAIWPHAWSLSDAYNYGDGTGAKTLDNVTIDNYACGGELDGYTEETAGIGTMCHEFSHCLGYPDYYDTDYSGGQGMGYWDLMDSGSYNDSGYQPAGYTGYERWMAGWKTPITLSATTNIQNMPALTTANSDFYIIYNDGNENEFFILENRQKEGWDSSLPGNGLLIVHVDYDADVWANNQPNDTPSHQRCTWIPADNKYQYTTQNGTKYYDFDGMATDTYPYGTINAFAANTTPAAKFYNKTASDSYFLSSSVKDITQNADGTISFLFKAASTVATPTFSPAAGVYNEPQEVTISCSTEGAVIYYTTDGTTPTSASTEYTTPITIEETTTIKAVAITSDDESDLATAKYIIRDGSLLLYESLSNYTGENDGTTALATSNENLDYDGWTTLTKVFPGGTNNAIEETGGCLKLGSSSAIGSMQATNIPLSGTGVLTFYLRQYGNDTGKVNLTVSGGTADVTTFTPEADWTECTAVLTNCTGNVSITLATTAKRAYIDEITLSATSSSNKQNVTLTWSETTATATVGETFTAPTLSISPEGTGIDITYSSSRTSVATIDEQGVVTIVGAGTTVITAAFAGNDDYNPASASYTLTVEGDTPITGSGVYELVTDVTTLAEGDKIILVNAEALQALSTTQNTNNRAGTAFTFNTDATITPGTDVAIIELGGEEDAWTFYVTNGDKQGYLAAVSSTKNYLHTLSEVADNATATISITDGSAEIVFNGEYERNIMRYNPNSGSPIFSCYSSTSTIQNPVQIYREMADGPTPTKQDVTLTWSEETATATVGETFTAPTLSIDPEGLDIEITYSSSETEVATIDEQGVVTIVGEGTTIITASFAGNDEYNSASASYTLTVEGDTPITGSGIYELVTDVTTLAEGDKIIIVNEDALQAISTTQNTNNRAGTEFTFNDDNTITPGSDVAVIEIGGAEDEWTLYVTNGDKLGYLAATSSTKNYLHTLSEVADNATATISITDGSAEIVFNGDYTRNIMRYNPNNGLPIFSCYSSTSTIQNPFQIYREIAEEVVVAGDINKDGTVNISDVAALIQIILGKDTATPSPYDYDAADVDGNGTINISDVSALIGKLLGR